jgi:hypothetical protein
MAAGPVTYEVALAPDPAILKEFDLWLEGHVAEMLRLPGFESATIHPAEDPSTGRPERVVRYRLAGRDALERYLREDAPRMRADGLDRFGDRFSATRRIIEDGHEADDSPPTPCANCGILLHGQYCSSCGQRARERMITFWELVRDAGDLLASLDSRLWRTLGLLLFRPGRLTLDYLQGRRARYVAPLRLFIASSLIFFFVATVSTRFEVGEGSAFIKIEGDEPVAETSDVAADGFSGQAPADDTANPTGAGEPGGPSAPAAGPASEAEPGVGDPIAPEEGPTDAEAAAEPEGAPEEERCEDVKLEGIEDTWAGRYFTEDRAREICRKIVADHGAGFGRALMSNLPTMMFIFLPLMAVVMKLLYPLSGRYYAEHLLFLVHYHAFFYIVSTIWRLAWWGTELAGRGETAANLLTVVITVYLPVYLFRAMRKVYEQGFWATVFKYVLLGVAYFSALAATFVALLAYTALSL